MPVKMGPEFSGRGEPSISLKLLWRRGERPSRGPKPALTLDEIVETAVAIADAEGLEAVSMRRIADALGAGTMTLYRYVPAKAELLDLMLDHVMGEAGRPGDDVRGWRARLEQHARDSMRHYERHPWMLGVSMVRPPLGPNLMADYEAMLAAAAETGLPVEEWVPLTQLIGSYVLGAAQWRVRAAQAEAATGVSDERWWSERMEFWEDYFVPGDHPTISRAYEGGGFDERVDAFEYGLQRLLDGVAARVAALSD
jgi:AcrR family transcriptional regulator